VISEIKDEKEKIRVFDEKILEWEKKLHHKRLEIGGTHAAAEFTVHSKKRERVLENRLDHVIMANFSRSFFLYHFFYLLCASIRQQRHSTHFSLKTHA
jgi:hypothetical protein